MAKRIVFTGPGDVTCEEFTPAVPGAHQVLVRTRCSLVSNGTETICLQRRFDPGTSWDAWVQYPFYPGYAAVGEILVVGAEVTGLSIGQRVVTRVGHASHHVIDVQVGAWSRPVPVPESVTDEAAAWFALAKITCMGARAARYQLGDSVLIIGAGPIGQMSVRWAAAAGASTIAVVDPLAARLDLARQGGATILLPHSVATCREALLAATGGKLPRVVIDSTGNAEVFAAALGLAADFGAVVVLGDTGSPASQRLTGDVINRGLTVVGAHDCHSEQGAGQEAIICSFLHLAGSGRFPLAGMISHFVTPEEPARAYEAADTGRATAMGILFNWHGIAA